MTFAARALTKCFLHPAVSGCRSQTPAASAWLLEASTGNRATPSRSLRAPGGWLVSGVRCKCHDATKSSPESPQTLWRRSRITLLRTCSVCFSWHGTRANEPMTQMRTRETHRNIAWLYWKTHARESSSISSARAAARFCIRYGYKKTFVAMCCLCFFSDARGE